MDQFSDIGAPLPEAGCARSSIASGNYAERLAVIAARGRRSARYFPERRLQPNSVQGPYGELKKSLLDETWRILEVGASICYLQSAFKGAN